MYMVGVRVMVEVWVWIRVSRVYSQLGYRYCHARHQLFMVSAQLSEGSLVRGSSWLRVRVNLLGLGLSPLLSP